MGRALGEVVVQDAFGTFIAGASVDLLDPASNTRIPDTVFADASSATTLALPLTTDTYGRRTFYLATGKDVLASYATPTGTYTELIGVADSTAAAAPSGAPIGPAGGDLTGTYPNPTLRAGSATGASLGTDVATTTGAQTLTNKALGAGTTLPAGSATGAVLGTDVATLTGAQVLTNKTLGTGTVLPSGSATGAVLGADVEIVSHKNAANGYAGLDASTLITAARLGTGTTDATTFLRGDRTFQQMGPTFYNAEAWGFVRGADNTTAWNTLRAQLVTAPGMVFFPHCLQSSPWKLPALDLPDWVGLMGEGRFATWLQALSSVANHFITNHVSTNGTTDPNAVGVSVSRLAVDCSQMASAGLNVNPWEAIHFDKNPAFSFATSDSVHGISAPYGDMDMHHTLQELYVFKACRDGVYVGPNGSQVYSNIQILGSGRNGFRGGVDSTLVAIECGQSGSEGIYINGSPMRLVGCKSWYSGHNAAGSGYGFHIVGINQNGTMLVGCEAQDNTASGFVIDSCAGTVTLKGCIADSNSKGNSGTYPGLDLFAATAVDAEVLCSDRRWNGVNTDQTHALRIRSSSNGNRIRVLNRGYNSAVMSTNFTTDTDWATCTTNDIAVNNYGSRQSPAYAATITPDITAGNSITVTLTGNVTIAAPSAWNYWPGARLKITLIQDVTGGRTITWNAVYKTPPAATTTASTRTVAVFEYDGTNWILESFRTGDA